MAVKDTITGLKTKSYSVSGPASYSTGGITHDASADFDSVMFVDVIVTTRGSLPPCDFEIANNVTQAGAEALGQSAIKIVRGRYDKATIGNVSGNPAGTTVRASKFAAGTTTGSSHNHTFDHNHPATTSGTESTAGVLGVLLAAGGGNMRNHTHNFDVPAFTGNSSSTTHTHDRSFEYAHNHSINTATADTTAVELASTTNISTTTFTFVVYGFGKA